MPVPKVLLVSLATLAIALPHCAQAASQADDAHKLLSWKSGFQFSDEVAEVLDWGANAWVGKEPCSASRPWWGVECEIYIGRLRVTKINMNIRLLGEDAVLRTELDPHLAWLPLNTISINGADIDGDIPPDWHRRMLTLKVLALTDCGIRGRLPTKLELPPKVQHLDLSLNSISGGLPDWSSTPLAIIDLSNNSLAGALPAAQLNRNVLQDLLLAGNGFEGPLPEAWAGFPQLRKVSIHGNQGVSGTIPDAYKTTTAFRSLQSLDVKPGTGLCGKVPANLQGRVFEYSAADSRFRAIDDLGRCPDSVALEGVTAGGDSAALAASEA